MNSITPEVARQFSVRLLDPDEIARLPWKQIYRIYRTFSAANLYDYEEHVRLAERLTEANSLPRDFGLIPARSWHPDVWTDVVRMRTLNSAQSAQGRVKHLCPLQFDIVDRAIRQLSMPGETVMDPFGGIGTVAMRALKLGRRAISIELNPGYHADAVTYCRAAEQDLATPSLFDLDTLEADCDDVPVGYETRSTEEFRQRLARQASTVRDDCTVAQGARL